MAVLPAAVTFVAIARLLVGEAHGVLLRQDVVPLVSVAVLFSGLLVWWVRSGAERHRQRLSAASVAGPPPPFGRLVRHVLVTATGGYGAFLVVVGTYYWLLGGQTRSFLTEALWGGAFLAFAVAVPSLLLAGSVLGRRDGRPPAQ
jgi:hypothetical protein